jgi:hypothetical protein
MIQDLPRWLSDDFADSISDVRQLPSSSSDVDSAMEFFNRLIRPEELIGIEETIYQCIVDGRLFWRNSDGVEQPPLPVWEWKEVCEQENWVGFTASGGSEWERLAKADWSRFLSSFLLEQEAPDAEGILVWRPTLVIEGTTSKRVQECYELYAARGFVEGSAPAEETLSPFEATYWKTLEYGTRCTVWLNYDDFGSATEAAPVQDKEFLHGIRK